MAAVAWLSVITKRGACCGAFQGDQDDTFAELLSKAAPEITIWSKSEGSRTNSNIFVVTMVTKRGCHSNQLFLSLLNRPTYPCVGKIRPRTMFSNWYGLI